MLVEIMWNTRGNGFGGRKRIQERIERFYVLMGYDSVMLALVNGTQFSHVILRTLRIT